MSAEPLSTPAGREGEFTHAPAYIVGGRRPTAGRWSWSRIGLRSAALGYLALLLVLPLAMVLWETFQDGPGLFWEALTRPAALHALWLTLIIAAVAVPANTIFGITCALALVRSTLPGRSTLNTIIDLPFTISPVVVGLALIVVYGQTGWLGPWLAERGIQMIFALPGMILATVFVSLPFVV